eukprot:scaffold1525_cov142-Cylindrotheca_fusiformis.AAC.158
MGKSDDKDVAVAETYSHSSLEEEEEEEDYDEEDSIGSNDDEEAQPPFWKQHWPAMFIAFLAAVTGHLYNQQQQQSSSSFLFAPNESTNRHPYVEDFVRTANISFCPTISSPNKRHLKTMDFYIPQEYFTTLQQFYQADEAQDDMYETLHYKKLPSDPNFACLQEQQRKASSSAIKFKGTSYYYKTPSLGEIYPDLANNQEVGSTNAAGPKSRQRKLQQPPLDFTGFAAKFVNLSPNTVLLHWDGKGGVDENKRLVGEIPPFESLGTATMPGHSFHVTPIYDATTALQRWVLTADSALVYYEPNTHEELKALLHDERDYAKYQRQLVNQAYARDYLISTQRTWLGHFPPRAPLHFMHPAQYIGQEHRIGEDFTLKVISVAPRAFAIDNFLSPEDCQAIVDLSQKQGLQLSTLHTGATAKQMSDLSTRSSSNTWLPRDTNSLTEQIYKKAAQVMQLDPELLQKYHESSAHHHSIAESLQVVRYKRNGEQYQSHHDFVYPSINHRYQPSRFATLLIYLNDVPEGGETRFPRAVNNYNSRGLEIQPKAGQAVLFYNMLEDGNMDDLSHHGSNPTDGHEKWLANLWIWNPIIG